MAIQTRTLAVLLDEIKREARVKGSDNLDPFIKALINELLLDYAEKIRYFELLRLRQPVTLIDAQGIYALPADFHKMRGVSYQIGSGRSFTLYPRGQYQKDWPANYSPHFYEVTGSSLSILPAENIKDTDFLMLDYYKYPTELVADGDVFPIPRLLGPLKMKALQRVTIYNRELQAAAALRGESLEQEAKSAVPMGQE